MIYISLKELIDDILLIVRNNNISESEDLSRDQIAVWIKAYKQKLIQDRLDRQKSGVADTDLIDEDIDDIFIREKGPYELEDVQPIDNNPIYTRRTKLKFENIYNDDASNILAVHDEEGCNIQLMNHVRRHYNYFRKYVNKELTADYNDGYIYIAGTQDDNKLKYIWVKAIYETLSDDDESDNIDENDIKIPSWMVPTIKEMIMKSELSFMLQRPSDDSNNATIANVKPHGPQDQEE